jgi:hypothetical protein
MKLFLLIFSILLFVNNTNSQTTTFKWAKKTNAGLGEETGKSVALDQLGNVYTLGHFNSTTDFDPGVGVFNMTSSGSNDIYILKLDADGVFIWAKKIGGAQNENATAIAVSSIGDIYIAGGFGGTVDFDPGVSTFNITEFGGDDIFVLKLDNSGNFIWAKQLGGIDGDFLSAMTIDNNGNVYTTGGISNTADFDPSAMVYNITPLSSGDGFISKLDITGSFVWAKQIRGNTSLDYAFGYAITVDQTGNVYSSGSFGGTCDFDPSVSNTLVTATGSDVYISKLDNNGNFVWAKQFQAATLFDYAYCYAMTNDGGSIYLTGYFGGSVDFDPSVATQTMSSTNLSDDIYICKIDALGNKIWAKQIGGDDADYGYSIAVDANKNVYTTGNFTLDVDFDPGVGIANFSSNGGSPDIYISKLDINGDFAWAKKIGGTNFDLGTSITVDAGYNVYTTGSFKNIADFDPDAPVFNLSSSGSSDAFTHKMNQNNILPITLISFTGSSVSNGNLIEWKTQTELNNKTYVLEKSVDGINFIVLTTINGAGNSNSVLQYNFLDINPFVGKTYYRLKQINIDGSSKYSSLISVVLNSKNKQIITVYPNPASNSISINYYSTEKNIVQLQVLNSTGIVVKKSNITIQKGLTKIDFPITHLLKGIYIATIKNEKDGKEISGLFMKN